MNSRIKKGKQEGRKGRREKEVKRERRREGEMKEGRKEERKEILFKPHLKLIKN